VPNRFVSTIVKHPVYIFAHLSKPKQSCFIWSEFGAKNVLETIEMYVSHFQRLHLLGLSVISKCKTWCAGEFVLSKHLLVLIKCVCWMSQQRHCRFPGFLPLFSSKVNYRLQLEDHAIKRLIFSSQTYPRHLINDDRSPFI